MYLKYQIREFWRQIKAFCGPRQKWLMDKIPNTWCDKDFLFELLLSESLIHYVEEEKCFETINWYHHEEDTKEKAVMIKEIYNWYKSGRTELQFRIDNLMESLYGKGTGGFGTIRNPAQTAVLDRLEKEMYDTNTKYMCWLIENRDVLWT